jgi:hypothetical protein
MAGNQFEYADWLAMECLDLLENRRAVSQFFNTDYSKEFKLKFPVGDTIHVPYPQRYTVARGLPYQPQAINRLHANISFLEPFQIGFDWDSAEQALKAPRGREKVSREILAPAMAYAQQSIDDACALFAYQNAASIGGVLGTDPLDFDSVSGVAKQKMNELGAPTADRAMIITPGLARVLKKSAVQYFNPVQQLSKQWRTGILGESDGFEFYESMSLFRHTSGVWAGAVSVQTAPIDGATSLVVTCANGDTVKAGDKFAVAGSLPVNPMTRRTFGTPTKTFTVLAAATGAGTSMVIQFSPAMYGPGSQYQNVDTLPPAGALLTLWPGTAAPTVAHTGQIQLALQRNAFALVNVELEEPKTSSVELVSQKRDPDSGTVIRFIREWDGNLSRFINRFDWMIGLGSFYNDACRDRVAVRRAAVWGQWTAARASCSEC